MQIYGQGKTKPVRGVYLFGFRFQFSVLKMDGGVCVVEKSAPDKKEINIYINKII